MRDQVTQERLDEMVRISSSLTKVLGLIPDLGAQAKNRTQDLGQTRRDSYHLIQTFFGV
jgi:hypothetical protein